MSETEEKSVTENEAISSDDPLTKDETDLNEDIDRNGSLASKILTGLILLIVGGGVALWGGPKLAPYLPQGMAPVAEFLAPQAETNERLAAQSQEFDDKLTNAINELRATQEDQATDFAALKADLESLNTRFDTLSETALSAGDIESIDPTELTQAMTTIANLRGELERMKTQQDEIVTQFSEELQRAKNEVANVQSSLDEVGSNARARLATAERQTLLSQIEEKIDAGETFADLLDNLSGEIPDEIRMAAQTPLTTIGELKSEFAKLSFSAIQSELTEQANDGTISRFTAFLQSQVATRSLEAKEGSSVDAILSRVNAELEREDFQAAQSELTALPNPAQIILADWQKKLETRVKLEAALQRLRTQSVNER